MTKITKSSQIIYPSIAWSLEDRQSEWHPMFILDVARGVLIDKTGCQTINVVLHSTQE